MVAVHLVYQACLHSLIEQFMAIISWMYIFLLCRIPFVMYLAFMAFLTIALSLAAEVADPTDYSTSTHEMNGFRLLCKILTIIWIVADIGIEFTDFVYTQ